MDTKTKKLVELRRLQTEADAIRKELGIRPPGAILYQSWLSAVDEEMIIVEADGFGHATTRVVEGDYPMDYHTTFEKTFETEQGAERAADEIAEGKASLDPA